MTNGSSDRLNRIEQILERSMQLLGNLAENQEQQQRQIEVLVNAALNHESRIARQDALIERLDAIIERLVYREGRNGNDDQPQQ